MSTSTASRPARFVTTALAYGPLLLLPLLAACGSDDGPAADAAPLPSAPSDPLWNPCTGLETEQVEQLLSTSYDQRTGTDSDPECTFTPQVEGDPLVDVNYQLVRGSLDELVSTFGEPVHGSAPEITTATVPRSDDARLIVDISDDTLLVSGFVQNGPLVQLVNLIDPAPFTRRQSVRAVEQILGDLAVSADDSGLSLE